METIKIVVANGGKIIYPNNNSSKEEIDDLIASSVPGSNQIYYNNRFYRRIDEKIPGVGLVVVFIDITSLKAEVADELKVEYGVDYTTGLSIKKVATDHILEYLTEVKKNPEDFALVMADIDHFKNINDTYGHPFGDIVLNIISQSLKQGLRSSDIIGRFGGEEIIFVLKNISLDETTTKLNQLLQKIQKILIPYKDDYISSPTLSFGASHVLSSNMIDYDPETLLMKLIDDADKALYKSKNNGRNQFTINQCLENELSLSLNLTNSQINKRRKNDDPEI